MDNTFVIIRVLIKRKDMKVRRGLGEGSKRNHKGGHDK